MPKGKASNAKCSLLRKTACLANHEECEWNTDIGRCKVKDVAQDPVARNGPVVRMKTTQQVVRANAPQVQEAQQVQQAQQIQQVQQVPQGDVLEVLTKYFIIVSLRQQNTPVLYAKYRPLIKDFIAVRFIGEYDAEKILNHKKLISMVRTLDDYSRWPENVVASLITSQLMQGIIS